MAKIMLSCLPFVPTPWCRKILYSAAALGYLSRCMLFPFHSQVSSTGRWSCLIWKSTGSNSFNCFHVVLLLYDLILAGFGWCANLLQDTFLFADISAAVFATWYGHLLPVHLSLFAVVDGMVYLSSTSIHTGTWSLVFSQPRTAWSVPALLSRCTNSGLSKKWSMRRPAFLPYAFLK